MLRASDADQCQHEIVVVEQNVEILLTLAVGAHPEVLLEEGPGRRHVVDGEVHVVQLRCGTSLRYL